MNICEGGRGQIALGGAISSWNGPMESWGRNEMERGVRCFERKFYARYWQTKAKGRNLPEGLFFRCSKRLIVVKHARWILFLREKDFFVAFFRSCWIMAVFVRTLVWNKRLHTCAFSLILVLQDLIPVHIAFAKHEKTHQFKESYCDILLPLLGQVVRNTKSALSMWQCLESWSWVSISFYARKFQKIGLNRCVYQAMHRYSKLCV